MPRDTETTRRRLLDAGAQQFALHGLAGARVDLIAAQAGVNKERIYGYFGNKNGFFAAVLEDQLGTLFGELTVDGNGPDAVGQFTTALFDRFTKQPQLARLLTWEGLESSGASVAFDRSAQCRDVSSKISDALGKIPRHDASQLVVSLVTLCVGWHTLDNLAASILGSRRPRSARRAALEAQAIALAKAATPSPS